MGPWWDACLVDWPRFYHRPLRTDWTSLPAVELIAQVERLARIRGSALRELLFGGDAEWGPDEENRARLLEIESYKLDIEWADRITDPDDPEQKRQRAQDRLKGRKPPKQPLVPLVALRPPDVAEREHAAWIARVTAMTTPAESQPRFHTRAQFSARLHRRT